VRGVYSPAGEVAEQLHPYSCVAASCAMIAGGPEVFWRAAAGVDESGAPLSSPHGRSPRMEFPPPIRLPWEMADLAGVGQPSVVMGNGHAVVVHSVSGRQVFIRNAGRRCVLRAGQRLHVVVAITLM
jgi:hypothetical protein